MYAVPAVPEMPRLVNVATPFTAVAVVAPTSVAPDDTVAVTTVLESDVATFPPASVTDTCGWVVNAAPVVVPADWRVSVSCDAAPADTVKGSVCTPCRVEDVSTSRCELPAVAAKRALEKSRTPLEAVTVVVPDSPVLVV